MEDGMYLWGEDLAVTQTATVDDKTRECRNAHAGPDHWMCYHWRGQVVPGKEALDAAGRCEACAIAAAWDGNGEPPSFMDAEEE
jgi:hypothetical protein